MCIYIYIYIYIHVCTQLTYLLLLYFIVDPPSASSFSPTIVYIVIGAFCIIVAITVVFLVILCILFKHKTGNSHIHVLPLASYCSIITSIIIHIIHWLQVCPKGNGSFAVMYIYIHTCVCTHMQYSYKQLITCLQLSFLHLITHMWKREAKWLYQSRYEWKHNRG